jgi:phage-related protein
MSVSDHPIFSWLPIYGSKKTVTPNLLSASFGDNYSQDAPNGINSTAQVWALSMYLEPTVGDQCFEFLQKMGGVTRFWWTPPRSTDAILVKTTGDLVSEETNPGWNTISCTFQQVFDPT